MVYRHALRSALTPVVTQLGIDVGALLGGAIITENVFGLPGLGQLAVQSVTTQDLPVIVGIVLVASFFVVAANIVVDLLTTFEFDANGVKVRKSIVGGLLGHWAVWTKKAVELLEEIKRVRGRDEIPSELLTRAAQVTDANAAFFDPEEPFDTLGALSIEQHAADRRLVTLCAGLTEADVDRPIPIVRRDGVHVESATRMLAHLFQHQIHHRGQVHAMLAESPVKPPQLDEFFCANEAPLRADELAEIGLSEQRIWEPR